MKLVVSLLFTGSLALGSGYVREFPASGPLRIQLNDVLDHPFYTWPETLLSYPVQFDGKTVRADQLTLVRAATGEAIPFQLSSVRSVNGVLRFAVLNFMSDLQPGSQHLFELRAQPGTAKASNARMGVAESKENGAIVLDTGAMKIRLPSALPGSGSAPGPILQVSQGKAWIGSSHIVSPKRNVQKLEVVREEAGPIFITYRLTYSFARGGTYTARVRAVRGIDFVQLAEEMEGLPREEGIHVLMDWTGFHPTHRHAPNHPWQKPNAESGWGRFNWEKIDQESVGTQHGVSSGITPEGEFPFRLGPYQPWGAYVTLTSADFWDERTNQTIGVFIDRGERWQDHEYAIWNSSNTLQVRYFFKNGVLTWNWPLSTGTRSTGIAAFDHRKDIAEMELLERMNKGMKDKEGILYRSSLFPMTHTLMLQNRYGTIDLNLVKDWVLEYPESARHPARVFKEGMVQSATELERRALSAGIFSGFAVEGTRQNSGVGPVSSRQFYEWWVDAYNRLYPSMDARQRRRITAAYLMMAYIHADEDYMPMKTMLSGHPNFLSDVKGVPALMAFLFPEHPMAAEWADEYEKYVDLNTRYHTRPEVTAWESHGGRWTENLGTYVWAFLRPAMYAEYVLERDFDQKDRMARPLIAEIGDWIVNALSAPFNGEDPKYYMGRGGVLERHSWGMVTAQNGPRRVHPPQGAHSERRMPARTLWLLGRLLRNYPPLAAESMMWAARPDDDDMEHMKDDPSPWFVMSEVAANRGTNPHLKSSKYTGYGLVLRSDVDRPAEVSLHLGQIDEGPNYRWGVAGEGGCGVIYYYAAGKSYSHNAAEDVGDRADQDTDFCSNFGVWKDGRFKSVGRNVLERPLYNLGLAQYAELLPRKGPEAYSWPEYQSRTVMLVSSDYFVTYDQVFNEAIAHRFSWFTHIAEDMPFIYMVKGSPRRGNELGAEVKTGMTKGVWYDGMGDAMAVITHKPDVKAQAAKFGARVSSPGATDLVFRDPNGVQFAEGDSSFVGTAGMLRSRQDGTYDIALFHGKTIGAGGLELSVEDTELGVGAQFRDPNEVRGTYFTWSAGTLHLKRKAANPGAAFYVDGTRGNGDLRGDVLTVRLPAGEHHWQLTAGLPAPEAPSIARTENRSGAARIFLHPVAGATQYRIETSSDNGLTWRPAGTTATQSFDLAQLANATKIHVRAISVNQAKESAPGSEYPVYVTDHPAEHPDGLALALGKDTVKLDWGEVLGAGNYRLYRRARGAAKFDVVYSGPGRKFIDHPGGVIPAFGEPGAAANALRDLRSCTVYEYTVAAVNGNGEGPKSAAVTTDPTSWVNWDPKPGEPFRRRHNYNTTNYSDVGGEVDTERYYPK